MACIHEKETYFGRSGGYTVCRNPSVRKVRCPECRCALFFDDGKGEPPSRFNRNASVCIDPVALKRVSDALEDFFDNALSQTPDGGAAFYEAELANGGSPTLFERIF